MDILVYMGFSLPGHVAGLPLLYCVPGFWYIHYMRDSHTNPRGVVGVHQLLCVSQFYLWDLINEFNCDCHKLKFLMKVFYSFVAK